MSSVPAHAGVLSKCESEQWTVCTGEVLCRDSQDSCMHLKRTRDAVWVALGTMPRLQLQHFQALVGAVNREGEPRAAHARCSPATVAQNLHRGAPWSDQPARMCEGGGKIIYSSLLSIRTTALLQDDTNSLPSVTLFAHCALLHGVPLLHSPTPRSHTGTCSDGCDAGRRPACRNRKNLSASRRDHISKARYCKPSIDTSQGIPLAAGRRYGAGACRVVRRPVSSSRLVVG